MNKKKIALVLIVAAVGASVPFLHFSVRQQRAVNLAKSYLSEKYPEKMTFQGVRFSWVDPCLYHVYFSTESAEAVYFEVLIRQDLTIYEKEDTCSADDYVFQLFKKRLEQHWNEKIKTVWKNEPYPSVTISNHWLYAFPIKPGATEDMSLWEMESFITDYEVDFWANGLDGEEIGEAAADAIYMFLQEVKAEHFNPNVISVHIGEAYITLADWGRIETPETILRRVNEKMH